VADANCGKPWVTLTNDHTHSSLLRKADPQALDRRLHGRDSILKYTSNPSNQSCHVLISGLCARHPKRPPGGKIGAATLGAQPVTGLQALVRRMAAGGGGGRWEGLGRRSRMHDADTLRRIWRNGAGIWSKDNLWQNKAPARKIPLLLAPFHL